MNAPLIEQVAENLAVERFAHPTHEYEPPRDTEEQIAQRVRVLMAALDGEG